MDVLQALFGQQNPAYRCAAGFSDSPHLFYSGFKPDGEFYLLYQIGFGGVPARPIGDGPDCHCLFPAIKSIPAENIELYFPVIIEANEALPDSGGAGFYRGGNAQRTLYRWLCEGDVSTHDDRWLTKAWGVNGGKPGSRSRKILYRNNSYGTAAEKDNMELCQSKQDHIHVYPGKSKSSSCSRLILTHSGDVLEWITWGGGGLGDPLTRPPERVAQEVHRRLVTVEGARDNYGVIVDPHTFNFDKFATSTLRSKRREERSKEGYSTDNVIDRGGTLSELMQKCEIETGLKAPIPQWEKRIYAPHAGLEYVRNWYDKMKKEGMERWDKA